MPAKGGKPFSLSAGGGGDARASPARLGCSRAIVFRRRLVYSLIVPVLISDGGNRQDAAAEKGIARMKIFDNITDIVRDDLKRAIGRGSRECVD